MSHPRFAGALSRAGATSRARVFVPMALLATAALLTLPPLAAPAEAQVAATPAGTGRISGTVTDSVSGRPLSAVQVSVAGTRLGALTDETGRYAINAVPAGTHTLEARRLGYRMFTRTAVVVTTGGTTVADLRLSIAALNLQAVVTTGIVDPTSGTRVPFTVGRVDAENAPVPATNAVETIQGKIAGVTVVPSGQPGSGTNILLRSPTSINKSNSPLIVVDGVILSQSFDASTADLEGMDIESVEVVKGAAAASLYGSRASAGVIQIRTRRGAGLAEGATRVTARSEVGSNALAGEIDFAKYHYYAQNAAGQYTNAAGRDTTRTARVPDSAFVRFQDNPYQPGTTFDHVDRFFDPGQFFKNSINIAQNAGRTNWFFSFVNTREDGVVLGTGAYQQNDVRLNLDHRLRENLTLSFSGYHSRSDRQNLYGEAFFDLINQAPDIDLLQRDPTDANRYMFQADPEGREENPLYVLTTEENRRRRARTQGSMEARFSPLEWVSFDGNVSYDRSDRRNNFFLDQGLKTEGFGLGGPGEISQISGTTDALNASVGMNLLGTLGPLTLRSTVRGLMERETNDSTRALGTTFAAPGVRSLSNATQRFLESTSEEIRSTGAFVTAAADYKGRYIVDALVRRDGSSLFGPEEQINYYYRMSGAYRVSQESWWPWKSVNEFKLRASRGTAGGRPDFEDQFETFGFTEGGGLEKENLGNRFLKPELATETELGIDAIFRDRYSLQLSYARNRVEDQLIQIPLAGFYGYGSQWQNAGTVEGNTLEATLEAQLVRRPTFTWRLGVVADRSRNKITEFNRTCFSTQEIAYRCAGETLGAMYGFRFIQSASELPAGVQARAEEFAVNDEGLLVFVGKDSSGTPYRYTEGETRRRWGTAATTIGTQNYLWGQPITLRDSTGAARLTRIGEGNPDFHFGISNNVSWRGFSAFALVDAQVGGEVYNAIKQRMFQYGRHADVDQAGKAQQLKKPVEYYVNLYAAADPTDYFVEDASFVKLREVSLRYRLGSRFVGPLARFGADGVSLAVIGRNLLTFTGYSGYDPEVGNGIVRRDAYQYPRYRTVTGSVELTF
jgi:TonB-linked SusC/RagA family outer membrane protein